MSGKDFDYMVALESFPLTSFEVRDHGDYRLHSHGDYAELVLVTGGTGHHLLGSEAFPIERGYVFFVPREVTHGYAHTHGLNLINIMFDARRLLLPEPQLRQIPGYLTLLKLEPELRARHGFSSGLQLDDRSLDDLGVLTERLNREVIEASPGFEVKSTALLCEVLVELSRHYGRMTTPMPQALVRLSTVLEWIDQNLEKPITVELLADKAHMSRSSLGRYFRECFGKSPMSYVIDQRVAKAEHLLRSTDTQIREVALRVGIDDANYFARLFRKHTGMEPSAFRANRRGGGRPKTSLVTAQ